MSERTVLTPEEVSALKAEISGSLRCALPGIVESFDAFLQTAVVRPALKTRSGTVLPLLRDVPVFFPGGRTGAVTWPVAAGDECLVVFSDAAFDGWFASGEVSAPASGRRHDLSDAFAFVGFRSRPNALEDFPAEPSFFGGGAGGGVSRREVEEMLEGYYTEPETDALLAGKSDTGHAHDGRYYTEAETDTKLSGKSDTNHTHDGLYYTEAETDTKLSGKKNTQSAVADPSASGTSATFIATLSQNAQGVITPTKKTVRTMGAASDSAAGSTGLVPAPAKGAQGKYLRGDGTWATPAVAEGSTGQTGTGATASKSAIATAAEDCEITTAQYAYWGKVAMLRLVIKKTTAVASGTTTLCTIAEGKRPRYNAMGQSVYNNGAYIGSDGTVKVSGAISAGASLTICSTYILA